MRSALIEGQHTFTVLTFATSDLLDHRKSHKVVILLGDLRQRESLQYCPMYLPSFLVLDKQLFSVSKVRSENSQQLLTSRPARCVMLIVVGGSMSSLLVAFTLLLTSSMARCLCCNGVV